MVLQPGDPVPEIRATRQDGERISIAFEQPTVLYFYPRDDTPGCTTEARAFDDELDRYHEAGLCVYGVSTDDAESHRDFAEKHGLDVDLLADPDGQIADAFGVATTGGAADRTTFVCSQGRVCGLYEGVRPAKHASAVLADTVEMGLVSLDYTGRGNC